MPTDHDIPKLIINKLTTAQYEQAVKNADELYLTPDDSAGLPDQTGQDGKYLTTNGTYASWADIDALPDQTGQSGKFLTTNGSTVSWAESTTWTYTANTETLEIE